MSAKIKSFNAIPTDILENELLNEAILQLPRHYNFEIHKSIWQLKKNKVYRVALQFPEGLLLYACPISDILQKFADVETVIMGDVTYGACCVDDFTAVALGCDYMIHYGHSCLVPIDVTTVKVLYVFVDIFIHTDSLTSMIKTNFKENSKLALVSTIQFVSALPNIKKELEGQFSVIIPQSKPLSPGEILGCTAPRIESDYLIYIGDGRFHLEAMMIANPSIPAYKYDPYSSTFTREYYDFDDLHQTRKNAIEISKHAECFGLILGTIGRQGNPNILENIKKKLIEKNKRFITVLLSEITPQKLSQFEKIDAYHSLRLSIDWGYAFEQPILSPYEAAVALQSIDYQSVYPMDFYAKQSLGNWTNYHPDSNVTLRK